jgi:Flp pilus assembly CpaF family ATPase
VRVGDDRLREISRALGPRVSDRLDERVGDAAARNRPLDRSAQEAIFGVEVEEILRQYASERMARHEMGLSDEEEFRVKAQIHDMLFGLGGLEPLLALPDVTDICVNGPHQTWLTYPDGTKVQGPPVGGTVDELRELIRRVGARGGELGDRPFDVAHPILDMMLPDGSRFNAIDFVTDFPFITIRRHTMLDIRWSDTVGLGMVTKPVHRFISAAVPARLQMMVAGPTGVGKTTLVRSIADLFRQDERVATIESDRELRLPRDRHPDVVAAQARPANIEGVGAVDLVALVHNSLRQIPDRIIVGEVRGPETVAMLWAMNTGHRGGLSTIHADSPRGVFENIALHGMLDTPPVPRDTSLALAGQALDLVVFMSRDRGSKVGYVSAIHFVEGYSKQQDHVATTEVFGPGPDGQAVPSAGIPQAIRDLLEDNGYDTSAHQPHPGWLA